MGTHKLVSDQFIGGDVDAGYGVVADAFRRNFDQRDEVGAACCVYRDGRKVGGSKTVVRVTMRIRSGPSRVTTRLVVPSEITPHSGSYDSSSGSSSTIRAVSPRYSQARITATGSITSSET